MSTEQMIDREQGLAEASSSQSPSDSSPLSTQDLSGYSTQQRELMRYNLERIDTAIQRFGEGVFRDVISLVRDAIQTGSPRKDILPLWISCRDKYTSHKRTFDNEMAFYAPFDKAIENYWRGVSAKLDGCLAALADIATDYDEPNPRVRLLLILKEMSQALSSDVDEITLALKQNLQALRQCMQDNPEAP